MRVLWVIKGLGPGGAERLLGAAARHHSDDLSIECAFVLPWKDHLVADLESAGVRTHCLSRRRTDPLWAGRLIRLVRDGKFDVVHVHSPLPGSVARLAARSIRRPDRPALITTEHNSWSTHRGPTRWLNRMTIRWDDETFCVTDEVRESMRGPAASRAITLRHGIDVARTAEALAHRQSMRGSLGLADTDFVVGTVANFRPQKDYPTLLRAAAGLADTHPQVQFVAVGQGPLESEIRDLHHELDLHTTVTLTGFRDDAVDVMATCDAFVLASQWEGLPVAVMEALALGLPIVATNVGGIAEQFTSETDSILVPPQDPVALAAAIARVADDADLAERLHQASLHRAPDFDVDSAIAQIEATYHRLRPTPVPPVPSPLPTTPRPRDTNDEIREAVPDDRAEVLDLLATTLGGDTDERYPQLFAWKHDENPFGPSPMWVATRNGQIVAFRAFMRWEFTRGSQTLRAVRAVDTATHPDHQGRGLFRLLTLHGIETLRDDGVDFVFNTPNAQSKPGYLKMGWREIGTLRAAVGLTGPAGALSAARSRVPADRWSLPLDIGQPVDEWLESIDLENTTSTSADIRMLTTRRSHDFYAWRFTPPWLGYRVVEHDGAWIIVRARRRGEAVELVVAASDGDRTQVDRLARSAARDAGASYALRLGAANPAAGFVALPGGGPALTWRAVNDTGPPPLSNWALDLGDIELF